MVQFEIQEGCICIYLQCDGVGQFGALDEDGGLTVGGWGGGTLQNVLRRGKWKYGWENKVFIKGGTLVKGLGALKRGNYDPLANYDLIVN